MFKQLVLSLLAVLIFIVFISYLDYKYDTVEQCTATVIDVDETTSKIEVRIGEGGPRIFVTDLGGHAVSEFHCGEDVDLLFYDRKYHVI